MQFPVGRRMKYYSVPDFVTLIDAYAFIGCFGLTSVFIPSNVTSIGNWAFSECNHMKSVFIQSGVKSIGQNAFTGCSSLESVTIPSSILTVGMCAFSECTSLHSLFYLGEKQLSCSEDVFESCDALTTVCVPTNYVDGSFCEKSVTNKASLPDFVEGQRNQCCEVMCNGTDFFVEKSEDAKSWENKSNSCVRYMCDNESGMTQWRVCESEQFCVNEKCFSEDDIDKQWEVIIDIEETDDVNVTDVKMSINNLTGIDTDLITIAVEINEKGIVVRIIVYVDNKDSAIVIADELERIKDKGKCEYGVLCQTKSVRVREHVKDLSISLGSFPHSLCSVEHIILFITAYLVSIHQ